MSYTRIHMTTKTGKVSTLAEIPNATLGALAIWDMLGKVKLRNRPPYWNPILNASDVWELFEKPALNRMERLVLGSTFDKVMVKRTHLDTLGWQFNEFNSRLNPVGNRLNNLSDQATVLRDAAKNDKCYAVFWTQTSVADDVWRIYEDGEDEPRWYDITKDTGHWFLFEECERVEAELLRK